MGCEEEHRGTDGESGKPEEGGRITANESSRNHNQHNYNQNNTEVVQTGCVNKSE